MQVTDFALQELIPDGLTLLDVLVILGNVERLGDVLHLVGSGLLNLVGVRDVHVTDEVVDTPVGEQLVDHFAVGLGFLGLGLIGDGITAIDDVVRVNLQRVELHGNHHLDAHRLPLYVTLTLVVVLAADFLDLVDLHLVLANANSLALELGIGG